MKRKKKLDGPPCEVCGNPKTKRLMAIIDGPCWQCGNPMKIAYIVSEPLAMIRGHSHLPPSGFSEDEINFANSKGVLLNMQFSATMEKSYCANTCGHCKTFCGDFYLFKQYISPAGFGEIPSETFEIGEICEECEELKD